MDSIIVSVKNEFNHDDAYKLVEIIANTILAKLKLKNIPVAAAFKIYSDDLIDLEVRKQELVGILENQNVSLIEEGSLNQIDQVIDMVLGDLCLSLSDSKLGSLIIKKLGSEDAEKSLLIEINGTEHFLDIPEKLVGELSVNRNQGIYLIDEMSRSGKKCKLKCMQTYKSKKGTLICDSITHKLLLKSFSDEKYVHLDGPTLIKGSEVVDDEFVVETCNTVLSAEDLDSVIQHNEFEKYFGWNVVTVI